MPKLDAEERKELPASEYACPTDKKLPINDAYHVRNAMARFDQVITNKCHPRGSGSEMNALSEAMAAGQPRTRRAPASSLNR